MALVISSISIKNLVSMENFESFLEDPLISWAELPISQCIMRKLKARYDESEVRHDCPFLECAARLYALKAPKSEFGFSHPVFREGRQLAAELEQFLQETVEKPHQSADSAPPPAAPLQRRDQRQEPQDPPGPAHPEIRPESTLNSTVPPMPPPAPGPATGSRQSCLEYTVEEFWEHCVTKVRTTQIKLSVTDLSQTFCESEKYRVKPSFNTVRTLLSGGKRRFCIQQVYAAAGLRGKWDPTCHTRPEKRQLESSGSDGESGAKKRKPKQHPGAEAGAAGAEARPAAARPAAEKSVAPAAAPEAAPHAAQAAQQEGSAGAACSGGRSESAAAGDGGVSDEDGGGWDRSPPPGTPAASEYGGGDGGGCSPGAEAAAAPAAPADRPAAGPASERSDELRRRPWAASVHDPAAWRTESGERSADPQYKRHRTEVLQSHLQAAAAPAVAGAAAPAPPAAADGPVAKPCGRAAVHGSTSAAAAAGDGGGDHDEDGGAGAAAAAPADSAVSDDDGGGYAGGAAPASSPVPLLSSAAAAGARPAAVAAVERTAVSGRASPGPPGAPAEYGAGGGGDSEKPEVMLRVSTGDTVLRVSAGDNLFRRVSSWRKVSPRERRGVLGKDPSSKSGIPLSWRCLRRIALNPTPPLSLGAGAPNLFRRVSSWRKVSPRERRGVLGKDPSSKSGIPLSWRDVCRCCTVQIPRSPPHPPHPHPQLSFPSSLSPSGSS